MLCGKAAKVSGADPRGWRGRVSSSYQEDGSSRFLRSVETAYETGPYYNSEDHIQP